MIYLDNAATSGIKPPVVIGAVNAALKTFNANPGRSGYKLAMSTSYKVYEVRKKIKDFFGASGEENIVFTPGCTYALNCVIKGVDTKNGNIVTSDIEHNAVMRPLVKTGAEIRTAKTHWGNAQKTLQSFKNAINNDTKLVVCTHASNVTGEVNPIGKIGEFCAEKGIPFAVDAAQTAGVIKIDVQKMHIDFLCIAAHKGLYAPMGVGILIAQKPILNTIIEGGTGTSSIDYIQPPDMPERLESGTVNLPGILGVGAGLDYLNNLNIAKNYARQMKLAEYLYTRLSQNKKIILYTPPPVINDFVPLISFNVKDMQSDEVARFLDTKNIAVRSGLHCAPAAHKKIDTLSGGTVRISLGSFNTKNDIDYLLNVLKFI